jgi:hypothetical protein
MLNTSVLNSNFEVRRGIERWENEGGRIRVGHQVPGPSHCRPDANGSGTSFQPVRFVVRSADEPVCFQNER